MSASKVPEDELVRRAHRLGLGRNTPKAGRALGELGPRALPALLQALQHASPFVRSGAVHGLGAVTPPGEAVVQAIAGALEHDADPRVRETASIVLGQLGPDAIRGARTALEAATHDTDARVQSAAAAALAVLPGPA